MTTCSASVTYVTLFECVLLCLYLFHSHTQSKPHVYEGGMDAQRGERQGGARDADPYDVTQVRRTMRDEDES